MALVGRAYTSKRAAAGLNMHTCLGFGLGFGFGFGLGLGLGLAVGVGLGVGVGHERAVDAGCIGKLVPHRPCPRAA